jgi:hypothetical protein
MRVLDRRWFGTAAGLCLLASAVPARAGQSARLVYGRTAEAAACAEEAGLRQAVARRLGYDPFVDSSDNTVVAEVRGDGPGLKARVFLVQHGNEAGGAREFSAASRDCDDLVLTVALAISIAIDPDAIDRLPAPAPESPAPEAKKAPAEPAPTASPEERPPAAKPIPAVPPPAPSEISGTIGAGALVASGPESPPMFGAELALGLRSRTWSLGLEPRWAAPSSHDRVRVSSWGATLVPCYRVRSWLGCYVLEVERLSSHGLVQIPDRDQSWWGAQGLRLGYRLALGRHWGILAKLDGLWAFSGVDMKVNGQTAFTTPRLLGRAGLGVDYEF